METVRVTRSAPLWQSVGFPEMKRARPLARSPILSPVSSAGLGMSFDSAWQSGSAASLSTLHTTCIAFVRRLCEDSRTPEQVLVALKREITDGGITHRTPSLCISSHDADDLERSRVYEQVFHWFLEACFDP